MFDNFIYGLCCIELFEYGVISQQNKATAHLSHLQAVENIITDALYL